MQLTVSSHGVTVLSIYSSARGSHPVHLCKHIFISEFLNQKSQSLQADTKINSNPTTSSHFDRTRLSLVIIFFFEILGMSPSVFYGNKIQTIISGNGIYLKEYYESWWLISNFFGFSNFFAQNLPRICYKFTEAYNDSTPSSWKWTFPTKFLPCL